MPKITPQRPWLDNPIDSKDLDNKLEYLKQCRNEWAVFFLCLLATGSFGIHQLYLRNIIKARIFLYGSLAGVLLLVLSAIFHSFTLFVASLFVLIMVDVFRLIDLFTFRKLTKEANERIASAIDMKS